MSPALWLLLGLQVKSYLRYFTRSLRTVKGVLLTLVGLLVFIPWLIAVGFGSGTGHSLTPDQLRASGPPILLLYCLIQVLFSATESTIYFAPAEVQFLFSGPFTRRQILLYKIALLTLLTLPVPLLFALLFRQHAGNWFCALLAMTLGILFLNLFTLATNLFVDLIGAAFYGRARKVALVVLLVGVAAFLVLSGGLPDWGRVGGQMSAIGQTWFVRAICWPLAWFFELFLARTLPAVAAALGMALLVDLGMLLLVFALDRNFLEVSAGNSARVYARIQQMRRGQTALAIGGGSSRWSLPDFPFWGGIGPNFWRQTTQAMRGMGRLTVILVLFAVVVTVVIANVVRDREPTPVPSALAPAALVGQALGAQGTAPGQPLGAVLQVVVTSGVTALDAAPPPEAPDDLPPGMDAQSWGKVTGLLGVSAGILVWLTIFMTMLVPFDFRGDIDRMALLKSLPIPTWALVIGQLFTPTAVTTLFHWVVLSAIAVLGWSQGLPLPVGLLLIVAVLFPSFNFLMYGIENLLFLIFPMRMTQSTPGDFQSVGRQVLQSLAKILILAIVVGVAAVLAVWVYFTMGHNEHLALTVVWVVLTVAGMALVPPIMVAFHHFDVGRDTPP